MYSSIQEGQTLGEGPKIIDKPVADRADPVLDTESVTAPPASTSEPAGGDAFEFAVQDQAKAIPEENGEMLKSTSWWFGPLDAQRIEAVVGGLDGSDGHEIDASELGSHSQLLRDYILPASFIIRAFDDDALSQVASINDPLSRAIVGFSIVEGYLQRADVPIEFKGHPEILLAHFSNKGILDAATLKQVGLSDLSRKLFNVSSRIRSGDVIVEDAMGEMLVLLADASRNIAKDVKKGFLRDFAATLIKAADIGSGRATAKAKYLKIRRIERSRERERQKATRYGMAGMGYISSGMGSVRIGSEAKEVARDETEFAKLWNEFADQEVSKLELSARIAIFDIKSNVGGLLNDLDEVAGFEDIVGVQKKIQRKLFESGGDDSIDTLFDVAICARTYLAGKDLAKSLKGVRGYAQTYYNAARGFGVEPSLPFRELSHLNRRSSSDDAIIARQRFEGRISSIQNSMEAAEVFNKIGTFYLQLGIVAVSAMSGGAAVGALGLKGGGFASLYVDSTVFGLTETALSSVVMQEPPRSALEFAGKMTHTYSTFGWLRLAGRAVEGIRGGAELGLKIIATPEKMAASWTAKEVRSVASAYGAYPTISQALVTDALQLTAAHTGLQGSGAMLASVGLGDMPDNFGSWEDLITLAIIHGHAKGRARGKAPKSKRPASEKPIKPMQHALVVEANKGSQKVFVDINNADTTVVDGPKGKTPTSYADRLSAPREVVVPAGRDVVAGESLAAMIILPKGVRHEFSMPFDRAKRTSHYLEFNNGDDVQYVTEKSVEFNEKVMTGFDVTIIKYPFCAHESVMRFAGPKQGQRSHVVDSGLMKKMMIVYPESMRLEDAMKHVGQYERVKGPVSGVITARDGSRGKKKWSKKSDDVVITNGDGSVKIRIPSGVRASECLAMDQYGKSFIEYGGRRIPLEEVKVVSGASDVEIGFVEEARSYRVSLGKIWEAGGRLVRGGLKLFRAGE